MSACNTLETISHSRGCPGAVVANAEGGAGCKQVELRGTKEIAAVVDCVPATEMDDRTEYLDYILSAKTVKSVEEAIVHINRFGSHHTDCIITENPQTAEHFMNLVDSAGVYQTVPRVLRTDTVMDWCRGGDQHRKLMPGVRWDWKSGQLQI